MNISIDPLTGMPVFTKKEKRFVPDGGIRGGSSSSGGIETIVAGEGVIVDDTDPANPEISAPKLKGGEIVYWAAADGDTLDISDWLGKATVSVVFTDDTSAYPSELFIIAPAAATEMQNGLRLQMFTQGGGNLGDLQVSLMDSATLVPFGMVLPTDLALGSWSIIPIDYGTYIWLVAAFWSSTATKEVPGTMVEAPPGSVALGNDGDGSFAAAPSDVKAYVDLRVPEPPASGTYTLQSVDGVVSWA